MSQRELSIQLTLKQPPLSLSPAPSIMALKQPASDSAYLLKLAGKAKELGRRERQAEQ